MKFYTEVVLQVEAGQGCSLISKTPVDVDLTEVKLAGGRSGGGGTQTVQQTADPWGPQRGHLTNVYGRAEQASHQPRTFYPGPLHASLAPETQEAISGVRNRARQGSPFQRQAEQGYMGTARGDYLHGGPGFNAAVQAAQRQVIPQVQSQFSRAGRTGSGLAQHAQTQALSDSFAKQYALERQHQMSALGHLPAMAQAKYGDLAKLAAVGAQQEGIDQERIDEAIQRHEFAQGEPGDRLARYLQMIQGNPGSSTTSTSPLHQPSRLQRGLGGALGGAALGGMLGGAGAGAAAGGAAAGGAAAAGAAAPAMAAMGPVGWAALAGGILAGVL